MEFIAMRLGQLQALTTELKEKWDPNTHDGRHATRILADTLGIKLDYHGNNKLLYTTWKDKETFHGTMRAVMEDVVFLDMKHCDGLMVRTGDTWHVPQPIQSWYTVDLFEHDGAGVVLERGMRDSSTPSPLDIPGVSAAEATGLVGIMDSSTTEMLPERWQDIKRWLMRWIPEELES